MKLEVEVLHHDSDTIIFQSSLRNYPSIALQGDTLSLLAFRVEDVKTALVTGQIDEETLYLINYVDSVLQNLLRNYKQHGER